MMNPDLDRIDEAAMAMLFLTSHRTGKDALWCAWKGLDWDAFGRLHEEGLISEPVGRAKCVGYSDEGHAGVKAAFQRLCCWEAAAHARKEEV